MSSASLAALRGRRHAEVKAPDERTVTRNLDVGVNADIYVFPVEILAQEFVPPSRIQFTFVLRYAWGAQWSSKGLKDALD